MLLCNVSNTISLFYFSWLDVYGDYLDASEVKNYRFQTAHLTKQVRAAPERWSNHLDCNFRPGANLCLLDELGACVLLYCHGSGHKLCLCLIYLNHSLN